MLSGPRVTLRAITAEDYPTLVAFKNDLAVALAGGGRPPKPMDREDYRTFRDSVMRTGDSVFVVETDGRVIGDAGLFNVNLSNATAELGITIGVPDYSGRGYGREIIGLLLDYGFRVLNLRRIWLEVEAHNERGLRCYRACGFVEEGRLRQHVWNDGAYHDLVHMGILRDEWTVRADSGSV